MPKVVKAASEGDFVRDVGRATESTRGVVLAIQNTALNNVCNRDTHKSASCARIESSLVQADDGDPSSLSHYIDTWVWS